MPLTDDPATDEGLEGGRESVDQDGLGPDFQFVPPDLASKCHKLIDSYHAIHGYRSLPDMLWQSDSRDVIERSPELMQIFANASKSRSAKRANDSFQQLATMIAALEMLARDVAGWGRRHPAAKLEAEKMLGGATSAQPRQWLTDKYLYPQVRHEAGASMELPIIADPVAARS
jgi:hypothetical protein